MAPPSTTANAMSAAFQHPLALRFDRYPRPSRVSRLRQKACLERREARSARRAKSSPNTPTSTPPIARARRNTAGFLYKPEAVLSILAFGFLSSMAYLVNTGRRVASDVSARAKRISQASVHARRYKARLLEKEYLESAIEATTITLGNTEDFLKKQVLRAEQAEERLRELAVSSTEIDAATRRTSELKIELKEKEAELEEKRRSTEMDKDIIAVIKSDVSKRRQTLTNFEQEVQEAQHQLHDAQQNASESLKSALAEKEHLEAVMEQVQAQLAEEVAARDNFVNRISGEEHRLQQTEILVDQTLADIEARRKKIDTAAKEAENIGKVASREKLALEAAIVREVRAEDIEDSLQQMSEKQRILRGQIEASLKSETQQASLCADLKKEVEEREKMLQEQQAKLNELKKRNKRPSTALTQNNEAPRKGDEKTADEWRNDSDDTNLYDVFESAVMENNIQATHFDDSITSTSTKVSTAPLTVDHTIRAPVKRRRGRPRKTDAEDAQESEIDSSKRGRGRARTGLSDKNTNNVAPKKKRGRPRKKTVTAASESAARQ